MAQTPAQDALRFPQRLTFGELLRQHRKARRLTQAELAERAGLSMRGINDLERGVRSTPAAIRSRCWPARSNWNQRSAPPFSAPLGPRRPRLRRSEPSIRSRQTLGPLMRPQRNRRRPLPMRTTCPSSQPNCLAGRAKSPRSSACCVMARGW